MSVLSVLERMSGEWKQRPFMGIKQRVANIPLKNQVYSRIRATNVNGFGVE